VIDAETYSRLEDIVRRESRSLLQYVGDSFPWITSEEPDLLAQIRVMIEEERNGAAELGRFLYRQGFPPPYIGQYPVSFTSLSFVSLDHLIPLLAANERQELERLQKDVKSLSDPEAKELVQKIIANKRRHLEALQALSARHSPSAVA